MLKLTTTIALIALMTAPVLAQSKQDSTASPGTGVNETQLPRNQQPTSNTDGTSNAAPSAPSGTRALNPGQNPDGTPRSQSPGNAPQLPGSKGQN